MFFVPPPPPTPFSTSPTVTLYIWREVENSETYCLLCYQVSVCATNDISQQAFWVSIASHYHKMVHWFSIWSLSCNDLHVLEPLTILVRISCFGARDHSKYDFYSFDYCCSLDILHRYVFSLLYGWLMLDYCRSYSCSCLLLQFHGCPFQNLLFWSSFIWR